MCSLDISELEDVFEESWRRIRDQKIYIYLKIKKMDKSKWTLMDHMGATCTQSRAVD